MRGPYHLAPPRAYSRQSMHDSHTNLAQHGETHHPHPPAPTSPDRSPHDTNMGSSLRPGRRGDEVMTGNHRPSYSPDIRTGNPGGPLRGQSPESAYPSQTQIWAELRQMSLQISSLVEAETRHTQALNHIIRRLDTIEKRLDALESALAEADGNHAKKASGGSRGSYGFII